MRIENRVGKELELVVFDWDGTLADSTNHIVECIRVACEATNESFPGREASLNIIGLGMHEALFDLFGQRDQNFIDAFRRAYSNHFFAAEMTRGDLFPGVLELIDELRGRGLQIAIATGKSMHGMTRALEQMQIGDLFDVVMCADQTRSKPDPLMLRLLLDKVGLPAERAVMVGDTEYDMDMAARIQMPRLAVAYGAHDVERMRIYEPIGIAEKVADILDIIS